MAVVPSIDQFTSDNDSEDSVRVPLLMVRVDGIIYNTCKYLFIHVCTYMYCM